jgi:hypothetical protein
MNTQGVKYRGFILRPMAAFDTDGYAAIVIFERDGNQRASGVLGQFQSPVCAREFALEHGKARVDQQLASCQ